MKKKIKCDNCKNSLVLTENELFFSEEKETEIVHCPVCKNPVYEGETDGWFFIQTEEKEELEKKLKNTCTYPMP